MVLGMFVASLRPLPDSGETHLAIPPLRDQNHAATPSLTFLSRSYHNHSATLVVLAFEIAPDSIQASMD